jgi:hypothetical protein
MGSAKTHPQNLRDVSGESEMDKIIERIKKMLALANDLAATEGERDTALRHAYNTMAKYNIDMASVDEHSREKQEARIDFPKVSWSWVWAKQVNNIVADLFFCKYYYFEKINGTQITHHFVGRESNAMTAAVMADWIVNSILKEARGLYKSNTSPATRSFCTGAMQALYRRVEEIKRAKAQEFEATPGTALVLASLYETEAAANELALPAGLRHAKARNSKVQSDAYHAGKEFGNNINLDLQVTEESRKLK